MSPRVRSEIWWPLLLSAVSAWTAVTAASAWSVLTLQDLAWLWRAAVIGLVVALVGAGSRIASGPAWRPWQAATTVVAQVGLGLVAGWWLVAGTALPWGAPPSQVLDRVGDAIQVSLHNRPPVPSADVLPVLLAGVLAAAVVMDLVAVGLRRPALGGLVVVAIWVATFFDAPVDPTAWMVALPAAGWCALLLASGPAGGGPRGQSTETWAGDALRRAWLGAAGLAAGAITASVVLTSMVPVGQLKVIDLTGGEGTGGNGLRVTNPMVDMRNQLVQGRDTTLLSLQTDDPDPSYLRLTVLTTFQDLQWTPGTRTVPSTNRPGDTLPPLQGVSQEIPRTTYHYVVTGLRGFDARWLPTAAPISSIEARGDWRYDTSTMDFLAADGGLTVQGQRWEMEAVDLDLREARLESLSPSALVGVRYSELPKSFPQSVRKLARAITADASSPFGRAVALQSWFRTNGGFTYDTSVSLGDGTDALEEFLTVGNRRGFCQQFASAMAAMARALNIPSRVVVGFLKPDKLTDTGTATDTWVYSAHDLHAWPELYFQGAGWVRFEPTPSVRAATVPNYTRNVTEVPAAEPTEAPSASSSAQPQGPSPRPADQDGTSQSSGSSSIGRVAWITVGVVLLLLLGAVLPWAVRSWRRRGRLRLAGPEDLWQELRDTAVDLDVAWPDHASVRRQADSLPPSAAGSPGVGDSLTRLRTAVEVERYARPSGTATLEATRDGARQDLDAVTSALWESAGPRTRRRARWWPASLRIRR